MTDVRVSAAPPVNGTDVSLIVSPVTAVVLGGGLAAAAAGGAVALLVAVAVTQAVMAISWILGTAVYGRRGAYVLAAAAAAGSDIAVSLFPHGRLGALLIVLGLAVPALFAQQLLRGAARVQVTGSLSAVSLVVLAVIAVAALLQTRHEFATTSTGQGSGNVAGTVAAAAAALPAVGLVVGYLFDMVVAVPRFDRRVRRGLPALLGAAAAGAAVGYLMLHATEGFGAGSAMFAGAALGALAALLSVAASFIQYTTPVRGRARRSLRGISAAALPLCLLAPVSFLLLLAIRQ